MDIYQVMALLDHRYPFLLVDRVLELELHQRILARKNVTINEPFFQGHFPKIPVMPGVLIIEAIAQASGLLAMKSAPETAKDHLYYLVGVEKARFRLPVTAGDQLNIAVELISNRRNLWKFSGVVSVDQKTVASADIICMPKLLEDK